MSSIELAIIIPSYNERENVRPLVQKLNDALQGINWEAIYVDDDSKDQTYEAVREVAQEDARIRCIHRIKRRGLSSAAIEGMLATSAPYIAVIDADLQHDETILPKMFATIKEENLDIVVGSRHVDGGGLGDWDQTRKGMSSLATYLGRQLIRCDLKDPMSGFFMVKRSFLMSVVHDLSGRGYKILLDLFASSKEPVKFKEVGYQFRTRVAGESKISFKVLLDYGILLAEKGIQRLATRRFGLFVLVGISGVVVHMTCLSVMIKQLYFPFSSAQLIATIIAMTSNYFINNTITFRDRTRVGRQIISGLASFYIACSLGAAINLWISTSLYAVGASWWVAGLLGVASGAIWNFASTSLFTWPRQQQVQSTSDYNTCQKQK